jgi:predicted kinase
MIVIVCGLPGSGKSYFASQLAKTLNAVYISSDSVRNELLVAKTYSEKEKQAVYNEMLARAIKAAKENKNVVLDATFYKNVTRRYFFDNPNINGDIAVIEVIADEPTIEERLQKHRLQSDADYEVYKKIKQQWQPLEQRHLTLESTNNNIYEMLDKAKEYLHQANDN